MICVNLLFTLLAMFHLAYLGLMFDSSSGGDSDMNEVHAHTYAAATLFHLMPTICRGIQCLTL